MVGKDIAWQWLDTQCPVHHSFLASGWPQATLHNTRPQMGNPCTLRRFWEQGKKPMVYSYLILFSLEVETLGKQNRLSIMSNFNLRLWVGEVFLMFLHPTISLSWFSRYSMYGLMPLLVTCLSQPTIQTNGRNGGRTQSKWAILG